MSWPQPGPEFGHGLDPWPLLPEVVIGCFDGRVQLLGAIPQGGLSVTVRVVPMRVGEVDLLVETVPVAGTEPTSALDKVGDRIVDAFAVAQVAIMEVASSTAEVIETLGRRARRPDQLEVEFGLSFSAKGNVIVVGGEAGAALRVKVVYDARQGG